MEAISISSLKKCLFDTCFCVFFFQLLLLERDIQRERMCRVDEHTWRIEDDV